MVIATAFRKAGNRARAKAPFCLILFLLVPLSGCVSIAPRNPLPADQVEAAGIAGIPEARFWGDEISPFLEREMNTMTREEIKDAFPALYGQPHNYLALSGGGARGAFGAGLLAGWTETGTRPEFQMVTGISTGALIAPFAFLGPQYDDALRTVYTSITTSDIVNKRNIFSLLTADAAADTEPLKELLKQYVDREMIEAIAREHRRGRGLYIGTTDADYMRPRIWDIGAIAASGVKGAGALVRKVMIASASIPGAMPPVRFEVTANGRVYDEIHIDGGTATQVFVYPSATDWRRVLKLLDVPGTPNAYIIRNSSLKPNRDVVELKVLPLSARSISSLIRTQGIGDLYTIYALTQRDGIDYNLAYIGDEFTRQSTEPFDMPYMKELYKFGFDLARQGYPWEQKPPGWEVRQ
jgi:predicted acylesterase/phospholipase RssA